MGWIVLSFLAFAVSAQIQSFKLAGEAKDALHGNPFLLPSAQTILVLGTDARPPEHQGTRRRRTSRSASNSRKRARRRTTAAKQGEYRADTLMLIRAGGGTFNKLSIPRDTFAEIPGNPPAKINAAFAFGGAALQIKTVEQFLGIKIDHVAIVDFTGFEDLIDAVGGVEVNLPHKLCAEIAGGAGGGQGGITLRLHKGENTLDGEKALAYSRIREPSECPGPGKSAFTFGYTDLDREKAQQAVISGIKDRAHRPPAPPLQLHQGPDHRLGRAESVRQRHGLLHDAAAGAGGGDRRRSGDQRPLQQPKEEECDFGPGRLDRSPRGRPPPRRAPS